MAFKDIIDIIIPPVTIYDNNYAKYERKIYLTCPLWDAMMGI